MPTHVHPFPDKEDSLLFQELTLLQGAPRRVGRAGQEASSRSHHALPGQLQGTTVHGPTHLTGEVGGADQGGDLPVGQDPSGRNNGHHPVHLLEKGCFFRVGQERWPPYRSPHFSLRLRMSKKLLPGDSISSTVLADLQT